MESNKQEKANLLNVNFLAKHMSTPLAMGGSAGKGSGMYMNNMAPKMEEEESSPAEMHGGPLHQLGPTKKTDLEAPAKIPNIGKAVKKVAKNLRKKGSKK